jgi:hypothetical protein
MLMAKRTGALVMTEQLAHKLVEPNSGLGKAYDYMLKRWDKLTLFLQRQGAPLDNNICERALKLAIGHRRNSLFYRTQHGASVGAMDLIRNNLITSKRYVADEWCSSTRRGMPRS